MFPIDLLDMRHRPDFVSVTINFESVNIVHHKVQEQVGHSDCAWTVCYCRAEVLNGYNSGIDQNLMRTYLLQCFELKS